MRHLHTGRKLGVAPHHRKAILRSLALSLIEHEAIRTTPARAKEVRWYAERIVSLAKNGDLHGRRHITRLLGTQQTSHPGRNRLRGVLDKVYTVLVPRFKDRSGGYTQLFRLVDRRVGDNAEMCVLRYLPSVEEKAGKKEAKGHKPSDKNAKAKKTAQPEDTKAKASEKRESKTTAKAESQDQPVEKKAKKKES